MFFFYLFIVVLIAFLIIHVENEKARLKTARTIPTGAPLTVANDAIEMLPVVIDKTLNDLSK